MHVDPLAPRPLIFNRLGYVFMLKAVLATLLALPSTVSSLQIW